MKAHEWQYQGEGGKHALFSHSSFSNDDDKKNSSRDQHCYDGFSSEPQPPQHQALSSSSSLLRVEKRLLAAAAASMSDDDDDDDEEEGSCTKQPSFKATKDTLYYVREFVHSQLSPYADLPQLLQLDRNVLSQLQRQTFASGQIPTGRLADWTLDNNKTSTVDDSSLTGQLLQDYRLGWKRSNNNNKDSSLARTVVVSWEIKPKAGYRAFSPLVDPQRRAKYQKSRYQLFQQLIREDRGVVKGWMATGKKKARQRPPSASAYDPIDFFSGEPARIRRALTELVQCPQNNLKIWEGSFLVWNDSSASSKSNHEFMLDLLTTVLSEEPCLQSLLALQKLDILDADGAVLVFERLQMLGGEDLLDSDPLPRSSDTVVDSTDTNIANSPIQMPPKHANLKAYTELVRTFSRQLDDVYPQLPSPAILRDARSQALAVLNCFSIEESVYLLQNWLLSLAMCDVSLFVTFQFVAGDAVADASNLRIARKQQEDAPGILVCSDQERTIEYRIKLIDYDKKPATKLRSRHKREECFNALRVDC